MSLCLTQEEIAELTKKGRYSAQKRVLRALGLDFIPHPDGTAIVDRSVYLRWLGVGNLKRKKVVQPDNEPRWDD